MAITFSKTSGSGNSGKIDITTDIYYGRLDKTNNYSVSGSGASATIVITQAAYGLTDMPTKTNHTCSSNRTELLIGGRTNAKRISIAMDSNIKILSASIKGIEYDIDEFGSLNVVELLGQDIGAQDTYEYEYTIEVPVNNTISQKTYELTVNIHGEDTLPIITPHTIVQSAGASYVYVSQTEGEETTLCDLTIESGETSTYVYIMSNDSWTISEV